MSQYRFADTSEPYTTCSNVINMEVRDDADLINSGKHFCGCGQGFTSTCNPPVETAPQPGTSEANVMVIIIREAKESTGDNPQVYVKMTYQCERLMLFSN